MIKIISITFPAIALVMVSQTCNSQVTRIIQTQNGPVMMQQPAQQYQQQGQYQQGDIYNKINGGWVQAPLPGRINLMALQTLPTIR